MRKIALSGDRNPGVYALVDDDDYKELSRYTWMRHSDGSAYVAFYGGVNTKTGRGLYERQRMHRYIMQPPPQLVVDHINGNNLDNRKSNLRICTQKDNVRNQRPIKKNQSGHKGVRRGRMPGSWDAYITCDDQVIYLGRRYDVDEAALLYDAAAIQLFGDFANLNIIGQS